ncbi:MAG: exosortase/archaeosortase family protein [Tepidisphaeraceae bacterium]|jgi:exosortase
MKLPVLRDDRLTLAHVALATAMGALGVLATLDAWQDIYLIARDDEEYSHIFVVPLVAIFLVWVRRMRLRHCKPTGRLIGPFVVAVGWFLSSFGFYRGIQSFWHGGAVLVVVGCMLSVLGKGVIFRFFPAFLLLVFLVPAPGRLRLAIASPLQNWTASITQHLLEACGVVNTEVNGNALTINGHAVLVAEACNGLRMVFALIMVGFAFCFAMPLRNYIRAIILLLSPLAAIFCNVIRMIPTIWMYGYMPEQAKQFHIYAGWAMLPLAFGMLYGLIRTLQWAMIPVNEYTLASQ